MNNSVPPMQQPAQSSPPPKRKIFTSHFLELIGLFVVIGFVVYAGISYWQDTQLTEEYVPVFTPRAEAQAPTDWKTYSGTSFSLKVPADWSADINGPGVLKSKDHRIIFNVSKLTDEPVPRKTLYGGGKFAEGEQLAANLNCGKMCPPIISNKNISLDGANGAEFILQYQNLSGGTIYELHRTTLKNGLVYRFWTSANTSEGSQEFKIFNQILSTFKFTDSADTSTWKTYTNDKFSYTIQYPRGWSLDLSSANQDLVTGGYSYTTDKPAAIVSGHTPTGGWWFLSPPGQIEGNDKLIFQIEGPDPVIPLDEFFLKYFDTNPTIVTSKLIIDGKDAIRGVERNKNGDHIFTEVIVKGDKAVYTFTYYRPDLYESIVQSFHTF